MTKRKPKLTRQKFDWAKNRNVELLGEPLRVNDVYAQRRAREVEMEVRKLHLDVSKQVLALYKTGTAKGTIAEVAMDASLTSEARMLTNRLKREWNKRFNLFSKSFSESLMTDVTEMSAGDFKRSVEKLSGGITIDTSRLSIGTRDIIKASTQQSSSLIKTISDNYLSDVQEALMRSIASPKASYSDTVASVHEMLQGRYKHYRNKAKNIVLDQTQKAYSNITDGRMRQNGISEYRWQHAGGSQNPRSYHRDVGSLDSHTATPHHRASERGICDL